VVEGFLVYSFLRGESQMNTRSVALTPDEVVGATRAWIERAVIGLSLCPFANAVYAKEFATR
jgi:hypothetical protein